MNTIRTRTALAVSALALVASACGDDSTEVGSETTTTTTVDQGAPSLAPVEPLTACGDAAFAFASADGTTLVRVDIPGVLASLEGTTEPFEATYDLADGASGASATLELGTGLASAACNDVIDADYEVVATSPGLGGTATLTIAEVPEGEVVSCQTTAEATLSIDGITFDVDGETQTIPALTLDSPIGWCPG